MANSGIDSDREATLARQSNGTYTLMLPVKQVTKLNVTGCLTGLTIGDVTYTGTLTGEIEKGNGILTIKDDAKITFNEAIAAGYLTDNNFKVTGVKNGTETSTPWQWKQTATTSSKAN